MWSSREEPPEKNEGAMGVKSKVDLYHVLARDSLTYDRSFDYVGIEILPGRYK